MSDPKHSSADSTPTDKVETTTRLPVKVEERYIHSDIFERLVGDHTNDLPGLIAYGIYQSRKRAWIDVHRETRGDVPSVDELKTYSLSFQQDALDSLRSEANGYMFRFAENIMAQRTTEMMKSALDARVAMEISNLQAEMKKCQSLRHHILGHVCGFATLVAVGAFFAFLLGYEPSLHKILGGGSSAASSPSTAAKPDAGVQH